MKRTKRQPRVINAPVKLQRFLFWIIEYLEKARLIR